MSYMSATDMQTNVFIYIYTYRLIFLTTIRLIHNQRLTDIQTNKQIDNSFIKTYSHADLQQTYQKRYIDTGIYIVHRYKPTDIKTERLIYILALIVQTDIEKTMDSHTDIQNRHMHRKTYSIFIYRHIYNKTEGQKINLQKER